MGNSKTVTVVGLSVIAIAFVLMVLAIIIYKDTTALKQELNDCRLLADMGNGWMFDKRGKYGVEKRGD